MQNRFIFVLFGSTGDLAQKKIIPALFKLYREGRLAQQFSIIAFSRRDWTDENYYSFIEPVLSQLGSQEERIGFLRHIRYARGHFREGASFDHLKTKLDQEQKSFGGAQLFFYFSVQPEFFENILNSLSASGLLSDQSSQILVEKPFGHDESSARELLHQFLKKINLDQLLLVDHYLAKEGLQHLIKLRKENPVLEQKFNNNWVTEIKAQIFETIGIEGRGEFYERIGALMDVGQNHLMEMLATLLMDITNLDQHTARADAIRSLNIMGQPILAQYHGYIEEPEVAQDSHVETYFKITLESNIEKWKGVSIILEAGKALAEKKAALSISFHTGQDFIADIQSTFHHRDAYEILIEKAIEGNKEYFVSIEEVLASWHVLSPILECGAACRPPSLPAPLSSRGSRRPSPVAG